MANDQRVLQVLSSTQRTGGVESMMMNVYRTIDRSALQFDFLSHGHGPRDLDREMKSMGARVFDIPFLTTIGYRRYAQLFNEVLRDNGPYRAVHTHLDSQGWVSARLARAAGIPVRVCHAHMNHNFDRSLRTRLKLGLAKTLAPRYATHLCACSDAAARSVFGRGAVQSGRVEIIHNGIDARLYSRGVDEEDRRAFAQEIGADGKRIVLQVARVDRIKNQRFVLGIAALVKARQLPWVFVCAGDGPMLGEIHAEIGASALADHVKLIGSRSDVPKLMQMSDALILPSLTEGFGMVLVEAQAAGLPVVASSVVPGNTDLGLGLARYLPVNQGPAGWIDAIGEAMETPRPSPDVCTAAVENHGFDAQSTAKRLMKIYAVDDGR